MFKVFILAILIFDLLGINDLKTLIISKYENSLNKNAKNEFTALKPQTIVYSVPTKKNEEGIPFEQGKANYSLDLDSGTVISQKNENERLQIASLTKLMTAYITMKELDLNEVITVPKLSLQQDDAIMGINEGEQLTVKDALMGLLINSGSDAAQTLAVASSNDLPSFVAKMNEKAKELKMDNTHYSNPVGWDDNENYSSAKDMAILSRILLRNEAFKEIVGKANVTIQTQGGRVITLNNTNKLLGIDGITGVKTGYTPGAGECLTTLQEKENKKILTIILGSNDRFGETKQYLDWIFNHFSW